jgi:hypothetical protein
MVASEVSALDLDARRAIGNVWLARAQGESATAETFQLISEGLAALHSEPEIITLANEAIEDELRHAERCWELACIYADRELAKLPPLTLNFPTYAGASEELRHTLHVVAQCCLNETTASAFLERSLQLAASAQVRSTLRELLGDEVRHARIGWAHLASPRLSTATRQAVAQWLPQLIATNLRMWRRRPAVVVEPVYPEHGVLAGATIDEVVEVALDQLILPGLRHVGIMVTRADCAHHLPADDGQKPRQQQ